MNIKAFWQDVLCQNKKALPAYFANDARICWHCTNERFTVAEYVRANCEYPGRWKGEIERMDAVGDNVVMAARVWAEDGSASFHVVSFLCLKDDKIASLDEYWGDDGPAPDWRTKMGLGRPIR